MGNSRKDNLGFIKSKRGASYLNLFTEATDAEVARHVECLKNPHTINRRMASSVAEDNSLIEQFAVSEAKGESVLRGQVMRQKKDPTTRTKQRAASKLTQTRGSRIASRGKSKAKSAG
ncbi:hypothetical protein [Kordiimonas aquimaris]|uniref:hypothetical protein n=1 Tax=Kordiimonas aquimaris TaxID=707591 RepID=UPI0021D19035|nr:hypothetical protein [Kordiimonas aquimaris]